MPNTIDIIVSAQNGASPPLKQVASDIDAVKDASIRSHPGIQALLADFEALKKQAAEAQQGLGKTPTVVEQLTKSFTGLSNSVLAIAQTGGPFIGFAIAIVGYLKQIDAEMDKTISGIVGLSTGIQTGLKKTIAEVNLIQAQASQDRERIINAQEQNELVGLEAIKNERIRKAKEENDAVQKSWLATGAQRIAANAKMVTEIAAAEADLSNKTVVVHAEKNAKLAALERARTDETKKIISDTASAESAVTQLILESKGKQLSALKESKDNRDRLLNEQYEKEIENINKLFGATREGEEAKAKLWDEYSAKAIAIEQQTADKRIQIIESLTSKAVSIAKQLGEQFSDEFGKLNLAKFLQDTRDQIKTLEGFKEAVAKGDKNLKDAGVTIADVDGLINQLKTDMSDAVKTGLIPLHDKSKEAKDAVKDLGDAAEDAGEKWLKSMEGISPELDAIIAKTRAAKAEEDSLLHGNKSSSKQGPIYSPVFYDPTSPFSGSNATPNPFPNADAAVSVPSYDVGGIVPGPRGKPMLAVVHGKEEIIPPEKQAGPSVTHHNTVNVSLHLTGTVIQQQRDWNTLVERLGQDLTTRLRRLYG